MPSAMDFNFNIPVEQVHLMKEVVAGESVTVIADVSSTGIKNQLTEPEPMLHDAPLEMPGGGGALKIHHLDHLLPSSQNQLTHCNSL